MSRVRLAHLIIGPDLARGELRIEYLGSVRRVHVHDRRGEQIAQLNIPAEITGEIQVSEGMLGVEVWLQRDDS